jgi:hypothetical protein
MIILLITLNSGSTWRPSSSRRGLILMLAFAIANQRRLCQAWNFSNIVRFSIYNRNRLARK